MSKESTDVKGITCRANWELFGCLQMSKKIIKLEKETASWKHRWEKSHAALLEMAADKQIRDQEIALSSRQLTQLQKLCRTLTEERAQLMSAAHTPASGKSNIAEPHIFFWGGDVYFMRDYL